MTTDLLGTRFSVRQFLDKPIPGQIVQAFLEAGRLSPSGGNEQPWEFGVITEKPLIAQISEIASQQKRIAQAPLLIVWWSIVVDDGRGGRDIQYERFPEYAGAIRQMDQNSWHFQKVITIRDFSVRLSRQPEEIGF